MGIFNCRVPYRPELEGMLDNDVILCLAKVHTNSSFQSGAERKAQLLAENRKVKGNKPE